MFYRRIKIKKIFFFFLWLPIFFIFSSCSFDNKSGIWIDKENKKISKNKNQNFKSYKSDNINFVESEIENTNFEFKKSKRIQNKSWKENNYDFDNNFINHSLKNEFQKIYKTKKISKHKINHNILVNNNFVILANISGDIIVYSLKENNRSFKFNFYKKRFKKIEKKIQLYLSENFIYAADNLGYAYSINLKSGKLVWAKNYKIPFRSNIKIENDNIFLINQNNIFFVLNKYDGSVKNTIATEETILNNKFESSIAIGKENIFFLNTFGSLYSLSKKDNDINWFLNLNRSNQSIIRSIFQSKDIIYQKNNILVPTNEKLYSINSNLGNINWELPIKIKTKPIIITNTIYFISEKNFLVCLNEKNGKIIYSKNILNKLNKNIKIKKFIVNSMLMANNKILIFFNDNKVAEISLDGELRKIKNLNHKKSLNPIIVNENLYYLNKANSLVVFN